MKQRVYDAIIKALYFADFGKTVKYVTGYTEDNAIDVSFMDGTEITLRIEENEVKK